MFQVRASATFLRTRVDDAGFGNGSGATFVPGERLLRRPPHLFTLGVTAAPNARVQLGVTALRSGERNDLDFASFPAAPVRLAPYTRIDASAQWRLLHDRATGDALTLLIRTDNLNAVSYEEITGFPAPGRTLFVGLRAALDR